MGQVCLHSPLISIEGLLSPLVSVPSGWGPVSGAFACPCFPWLGFIVCLCAPLLFSVWLPSALWASFSWLLSLHRLVGPLATVSSFGFPSFLSLAASCLSLPLVFHLAVLGSPPVAWWPSVFFGLAPFSFLERMFLFYCLGFQLLVFRVSRWSPLWFSFRAPLLSFLPLGSSYIVGVHCVPCASLLSIILVALSFSVLGGLSFFYPSFPVILIVLPFVSPWFRSFFFSCLVFLFCALTSGPPGVSPVTALSSAGHPASLSSAVAAASSPSFGFSPLAYVFWGCSPLGGVSLGSGCAGASRLLVLFTCLIFTP